jgi:hypothetical protein
MCNYESPEEDRDEKADYELAAQTPAISPILKGASLAFPQAGALKAQADPMDARRQARS